MARIAIVTGGGSGLGRAIAVTMADAGYHVVVAGRTASSLEETVALAGSASAVVTDVASASSVDALFSHVAAEHGRLDVLVNNAGVFGPGKPVTELTDDEWQSVVDINLTGAFRCARAAFRLMSTQSPRGGRIINNGSVSAHAPRPNAIAYTATKHAMTGLTKALSLEGRAHDIACGQIDIGNAATELTAGFAAGVPQADGSVRAEPTMDAQHAADLVLHMASLPLTANVQFLTVTATAMPFIGRG